MIKRRLDARGFTLIELLISIVLLGVVSVLSTAGLRVATSSWSKTFAHTQATQERHLIERFLYRLLSETHAGGALGQNDARFNGEEDRLSFSASLPAHRSVGRMYTITLLRQVGQDNKTHLIMNYQPEDTDGGQQIPAKSLVLFENVSSAKFQYFGSTDNRVTARWHPRWHAAHLPDMVKLTRQHEDQSQAQLVVPIHLARAPGGEQLPEVID